MMALMIAVTVAPLFSEANVNVQAIKAQGVDNYYSYNFGVVPVNFNRTVDFSLSAQGPTPTEIQQIHIEGMMYDARTNCPRILQPGQECTTRVSFWPSLRGFFPGRLIYFLGDSHVVVDLSGWGQL